MSDGFTEPEARRKALAAAVGSNYWDLIGFRLGEADESLAVLELDVQDRHLNPIGTLHGGVSAAMLDTAMGVAIMAANPGVSAPVTLSFNVNYLAPLKAGKVTAEGEIVHRGRNTVTVQGRVKDEEGNLCVYGTGSFRLV